jgi:hypothetical protein
MGGRDVDFTSVKSGSNRGLQEEKESKEGRKEGKKTRRLAREGAFSRGENIGPSALASGRRQVKKNGKGWWNPKQPDCQRLGHWWAGGASPAAWPTRVANAPVALG